MELAPDPALDKAPGVKLAAEGLNLNSLALGFSLNAGAVDGRPSRLANGTAALACTEHIQHK